MGELEKAMEQLQLTQKSRELLRRNLGELARHDDLLRLECLKIAKSDLYRPPYQNQWPTMDREQAPDSEVFARARVLFHELTGRAWPEWEDDDA